MLLASLLSFSYLTKPKPVEAPILLAEPLKVEQVVAVKKQIVKYKDPVTKKEREEIAEKIAVAFPQNAKVMVAIALTESGLNKNATGYNCYYKVATKNTGTYDKIPRVYLDYKDVSKVKVAGYRSTVCRPEDRRQAWSKDGGVFQINQPKPEDYNVDNNIARAKHKYDTQGLGAWTVYNTGEYKKHLARAEKLLE